MPMKQKLAVLLIKDKQIIISIISISLIFIFSIIQTLDYPDYLLRSWWVRIIEVQLYM